MPIFGAPEKEGGILTPHRKCLVLSQDKQASTETVSFLPKKALCNITRFQILAPPSINLLCQESENQLSQDLFDLWQLLMAVQMRGTLGSSRVITQSPRKLLLITYQYSVISEMPMWTTATASAATYFCSVQLLIELLLILEITFLVPEISELEKKKGKYYKRLHISVIPLFRHFFLSYKQPLNKTQALYSSTPKMIPLQTLTCFYFLFARRQKP